MIASNTKVEFDEAEVGDEVFVLLVNTLNFGNFFAITGMDQNSLSSSAWY